MLKNILLAVPLVPLFAFSMDFNQLRAQYLLAVDDEKLALKLHQSLKDKPNLTPTELAYYAGLEALQAKFSVNPFTQVSRMKSSRKKFEEAIKKDPENFEIRFLSFSFQNSIPSYLVDENQYNADLKMLVKCLSTKKYGVSDTQFIKKSVFPYLLQSKKLSEQETHTLKKIWS